MKPIDAGSSMNEGWNRIRNHGEPRGFLFGGENAIEEEVREDLPGDQANGTCTRNQRKGQAKKEDKRK